MNLLARIPQNCSNEIQWIVSVMVEDFLDLRVTFAPGPEGQITLEADGKQFISTLSFFPSPDNWLTTNSVPSSAPTPWDTEKTGLDLHLLTPQIPILFGKPLFKKSPAEIHLEWDLFGSAFFLLSRYEEAIIADFDPHHRILLHSTLEGRYNLLHRPLVDEYLEILWGCLHQLWPQLVRRPHSFAMEVSCDLDEIFSPGASSLVGLARKIGGELFLQGNLSQATTHVRNYFLSRKGDHSADPYFNAIESIMDINETVGNRVTFNVKPLQSHPAMDAAIDLDSPVIRDLLNTIHQRGHKIGFHPGYLTFDNPVQFNRELANLLRVLAEEKIETVVDGGRQHYLRWKTPETARLWEQAGLQYDSTLGFAEQAGFRCGTSKKFRMYDVKERRTINLLQQPLILMEVSVISGQYMGLGKTPAALKAMQELKETCRFYGGCFSLLWHNSFLRNSWDMETYGQLCAAAARKPVGDTAPKSQR